MSDAINEAAAALMRLGYTGKQAITYATRAAETLGPDTPSDALVRSVIDASSRSRHSAPPLDNQPATGLQDTIKPLAVPLGSMLESLPVLIAGSPLVPVLIARRPTSLAHWLQLLRLVERSGAYRSAVTARLSGVSRCLAWCYDAERSFRHVENHASQRVGIDLATTTLRDAARLVLGCGGCPVAVVPQVRGVYLVGPAESPPSCAPQLVGQPVGQSSPSPSNSPQSPLPWANYQRIRLDPIDGDALLPIGWGDSRFSSRFTQPIPFSRSRADNIAPTAWD